MDPLLEFALTVKAIQREIERAGNDAMRPLGLTAAQADSLVVIGRAGPLSLGDLGGLLIAEAGHPSRLVERLVDAGLVERRVATGDRRRVEITLTTGGRRLEKRVLAAREGVLDLGRAMVGKRDLEPGLDLLRDLAAQTSYAELIARRRKLFGDEAAAVRTPAKAPRD